MVTLFQAWWGLPFKPGSTGVLVCGMEPIQIDSAIAGVNVGRWPVTDQMNILGDWVQSDSGIRHDRQLAKNAMWALFWAHSGCRRAAVVSPFQRVRMLYRTITSALVWLVSAWPFQKSVAQEIDTVQCQMLCRILPCAPRAFESIDCFDCRRKRNARNLATEVCLWSLLWAARQVAWHKHLERGAS